MPTHHIFKELEEAARKGRHVKFSKPDLGYDIPDQKFIEIVSHHFPEELVLGMSLSIGMDLVRSGEWERRAGGFDLKRLRYL